MCARLFFFQPRGLGSAAAIGFRWGFFGCGKRSSTSEACLDSVNRTKNCRYVHSTGSVGDALETGVDNASRALH